MNKKILYFLKTKHTGVEKVKHQIAGMTKEQELALACDYLQLLEKPQKNNFH